MVDPKCGTCPLSGSTRVCGEGVIVNTPPDFDRDTANLKVLLDTVELDPNQDDPYDTVWVGMAPATDETVKGHPYVGVSGQLLKALLVKLGYNRVYLTNSLECAIPTDWDEKDERRQDAVDCCRERLIEEIKDHKPTLIVAMGAMPMTELLGDYGITKIAGRVFPTDFTLDKIAPILPTVHPASVWRRYDEFYDFVEQMQSGLRWLDGSYQSAKSPQMVIADESNIDSIIAKIKDHMGKGGIGSIDLETTGDGFYPYGWSPDRIRCIVVALDNTTAYIIPGNNCTRESNQYLEGYLDETDYNNLMGWPGLKEALEMGRWRTQNGQFDCGFLLQEGITIQIEFDTMLSHYTLDEREFVHGLKRMAHKYLGASDWEEDLRLYTSKKKDSYDKIPNSKLFWYASHDGIYTNQLSERLEPETTNDWALNNILLPSANMFNDLRHRGIRIDPRELMRLDETLEVELQKAEDELTVLCGEPINPGSPKEVMELIYDKLKFPIHRRYGRTSNKKALNTYLPNPIIEGIIECRHLSKMKNTYVESLAKFIDPHEMRIHPFTRLSSSVTGRISTEDPSVMNVIKRGGIMRIYLPDDGRKFGVFDVKGMELRCGALVTGDKVMKEILLDPTRDPHGEVATMMYGKESAAVKRGTIKTVIFGYFYGRGVESIQYALRISREEAEELVRVVEAYFPGLPLYQAWIKKEIREKGYLVSWFGRYRRFGLLTRENIRDYERQGYNFPVQSMASDINLLCMIEMNKRREEFRAVPLWPIHDAIIFDIEDESCVAPIKSFMESYMEDLVGGQMKFIVEEKVGDNWGDAMPLEDEDFAMSGEGMGEA